MKIPFSAPAAVVLLAAAAAQAAPVALQNLPPTGITPTSATAGARILSYTGNAPGVTLYYGPSDGGTIAASWAQSLDLGQVMGAASGVLPGLQAGTPYFYRALARHGADENWAAESATFTTPVPTPPVMGNTSVSRAGLTDATVEAEVLSTGQANPTVTFYYGLTDGGTNPAAWSFNQNAGIATAGVSAVLPGLTPGTTYFFQASATNAAGTAWSPVTNSFTTSAVMAPTLRALPATHVRSTMATLNAEVTADGLQTPALTWYWGLVDGGTNPAAWQNTAPGGSGLSAERVLTGLTPNQGYAFRVSATNSGGTSWSPASQFFTTAPSELPPAVVINEIHYDPPDRTLPQEFIELYNPGTAPVDLTGWRLTGGIDYTFGSVSIPPGGFFCAVQNPARFAATWPAAAAASAGPWTGKLRNTGETIELRNASNVLVNSVDYGSGFPWPTAARGAGASMELLHPSLDPGLGASWRRSIASPTPGAVNSVLLPAAGSAPPAIRRVAHSPQQPGSNDPVQVSALITDPEGVASAILRVQAVEPGLYIRKTDAAFASTWVEIPMRDDGLEGDAVAGDSHYTAIVPAGTRKHRNLVRYQISVTDAAANTQRVPYADDEQPNFAYFIYDTLPAWTGAMRPTSFNGSPATPLQQYSPEILASIEPWHLIANESDVIKCQYDNTAGATLFRGTLVHRGEVYDHITYQVRGIGSTYVSGKNKWGLKFSRARDFQAYDNWGQPYAETWNSLGLNACASPWASVNRGAAGIDEALSFRLFELGGVPSLRTNYVHWRIIRRTAEVSDASTTVSGDPLGPNLRGQYSGDLWGLYLALEPTEGNFLDERGLEDGNIYAIEGNNGDKKHQGETQPANTTDWNTFRNGIVQANQSEAWYRANNDLETLFTFMGLSRLVGNVDVRPGDNYRYYHRPGDNRWVIMPYDLDMMFIAAHHWGGTMDNVVVAGAPNSIRALSRHPAIALEYRNRCRELLSLVASDSSPSGGQIGQLVQEYAQLVNPAEQPLTWSDLDAALWNLHPRSAGGGANTGQSSHKGNFFRATYLDGGRGGLDGTVATGSWIRNLPDPDNDRFSDHEGLVQWYTRFATNTYPYTGTTWIRKASNSGGGGTDNDVNRQKGYGYKYLEWESLYGGYVNANVTPPAASADVVFPATPVIFRSGPAGFPANDLRFTSTDFSDPDGPATAAAVQWRVGQISAPGIPGHDPTQPWIYELNTAWTSPEIALTGATVPEYKFPGTAVRPGSTYRARVRHKDSSGRWSFWSAPIQFAASTVDTSSYQAALRITEINYDPSPVTAAEASHPNWNALWNAQQFEFLELTNISAQPVDLTDLRFTKGIDYAFLPGTVLAPGAALIVAKNPTAFAIRYGASPVPAPGGFDPDSLSNSGEQIKLSYGAGIEIFDFQYSDDSPWPTSPNGQGNTLVLIRPSTTDLDHGDPWQWRASTALGGNPGTSDVVSYDQWAATIPGLGAVTADDDADGLPNFVEYVFGSQPGTASPEAIPVPALQGTRFTISFTWDPTHTDYQIVPEFSLNGDAWQAAVSQVDRQPAAAGKVTDTWESPLPMGSGVTRQLGRLRIQEAP